jgi:regulator of protease activity HflC (stomatin/prohibitin superfamily)
MQERQGHEEVAGMTKVTVEQGFSAVVRVDGLTATVLGPGRHQLPTWGAWRRRVVEVDLREQLLVVTGQEVAAADVPGVKVSAVARWRISDPVTWLDVAVDPWEELRLSVQLAVRDWAASAPVEQLIADRAAATDRLTGSVSAEVARLGIAATQVSVRDIVVPAELRRAAMAVQSARQEGLAALERARGETAAMRALANGARVLEEHPALLQLRTVQAAGESAGTVVVHVADGRGATTKDR